MQRTIFHIDVNSAFLSWSALKQLEEDPRSVDLRTIPSAVGGDVETRHGVITAKSIPAKAYKIKTGEPVVKALAKCPDLVLVKSDFVTYRKYSRLFIDILREYTDKVQQVSIDEAYLDVTDLVRNRDDAIHLADNIKNSIYERLGFTVNVGISENKFLAKMASDFEKPNKIHTLYLQEIRQKMWPLPVREMYGCGKATADKLNELGFQTIGDVAGSEEALLKSLLGEKAGEYVFARANGLDDSPVEVERQEAKSYSNEMTTIVDVTADNYEKEGLPILLSLSSKVSGRLRKQQVFGSTISVMVKTGNFQRYSRQTSLYQSTNNEKEIQATAEQLMKELLFGKEGLFKKGEVLRLIGVGVSNLDHGDFHQMNLMEWAGSYKERQEQHKKKEKLDAMMEKIEKKYGKDAVKKGTV